MKNMASKLIMLVALLALANSGIYFVAAYSQMNESSDGPSQIETMLFATAAIAYLPLGIWVVKSRLHSRAPYVIASLLSFALIGLYVVSRNVQLPVVGLQGDMGVIDITAKILQGSIIVASIALIRNWNRDKPQVTQ